MTAEPAGDILPKFGDDTTPSIAEQAKAKGWEAGIFDFGKADTDDCAYFNPSLIERPDGLWMIVRRAVFDGHDKFGHNSVWAFKLAEDLKPEFGNLLKWLKAQPQEHFEDPRAVFHNDQTWLSCCNFIWWGNGEWTGAHQTLGVFDQDWICKQRWDPQVGYNPSGVDDKGKKNEKNWLWFFVEGKLTVLYHSNPWQIAQFGKSWSHATPHETDPGPKWYYGDIRGGTPPVLVDGVYWTFFHSSVGWIGRFRRYYIGAIGFESQPPFAPLYLTREPILVGNQADRWAPKKPLCVFPCGALLRSSSETSGPEWLITMGINDLACGWLKIPHSAVIELAKPVMDHVDSIDLGEKDLSGGVESRHASEVREIPRSTSLKQVGSESCASPAQKPSKKTPSPSSDLPAPSPTVGDHIRSHVGALAALATTQSRRVRILSELRKRKLAPKARAL